MSDLPEMRIGTDEGELIATPLNTSLFMHVGEAAMYDHVFISDEENGCGRYIFRYNQTFNTVVKYMRKHRYPMHLNQLSAAQCDIKAYDAAVDRMAREVDDWVIPDDWKTNL